MNIYPWVPAPVPFVPGSLHHTTPKHTKRYDGQENAQPQNVCIEAGIHSSKELPGYLPPQWSAYVQPEGQLYFQKDAELRVVTDADLYSKSTTEKISYWVKELEDRIRRQRNSISAEIELFIQIDDNDCLYYFVDHSSHIAFWLEAVDTEDLDMLPAVSQSHLRLALHELYWIHVEFFPMHLKELDSPVLEELISIYSYGLADQMTSRNSTFHYSEGDCAKFLKILKGFRGHLYDGYAICVIARLWHLVYNHRFSTHYGEPIARLSRDQSILAENSQESWALGKFTYLCSLGTSEPYTARLNDIYTDHLVYAHQWQPFMTRCLKDWRSLVHVALLSLILHLLLIFLPTIPVLTIISASCFATSLVFSILLINRHEHLEDGTAVEALGYLNGVRSDQFKFQWVAFAYALPKALYLWGLVGFILNCLIGVSLFITASCSISWVWMPTFLGLLSLCTLVLVAFSDATCCGKILEMPNITWGQPKEKTADMLV